MWRSGFISIFRERWSGRWQGWRNRIGSISKCCTGKGGTAMAVRTVLQLGNPKLREVALPVSDPASKKIVELIADLADTLAFWRTTTGYGRAIAAPQIGVNARVIFLQLPGAEPWPLINPVITGRSDEKVIVWDACLSFLSIFMQVERHREVQIRYEDMHGKFCELCAGDDRNLSELLQHEIDHLDGILAIDRVTDVKTICTREEFEKRFKDASPYACAPTTVSG